MPETREGRGHGAAEGLDLETAGEVFLGLLGVKTQSINFNLTSREL